MPGRTEKRNEQMLTAKEARFVSAYLKLESVKDAAAEAGYASAQGLLKRPRIAKELRRRMGKAMSKNQVTAERVIKELAKIAFANVDDFVDDEYRVQPKPSRKKMAAVQEVTTETKFEHVPDGPRTDDESNFRPRSPGTVEVTKVRVKMYSKLDALDKLGRHFKLFTDKVELTGELAERMARTEARLANEGAAPDKQE